MLPRIDKLDRRQVNLLASIAAGHFSMRCEARQNPHPNHGQFPRAPGYPGSASSGAFRSPLVVRPRERIPFKLRYHIPAAGVFRTCGIGQTSGHSDRFKLACRETDKAQFDPSLFFALPRERFSSSFQFPFRVYSGVFLGQE